MAMADSAKTRLRRTRTGCLKCRVRRRKCDEGKPKCQRCIDAGFECQYGTRLSFLEKNAITATAPEKDGRSSYSALRFVQPDLVSPSTTVRFQDEHSQSQDSDKQTASAASSSKNASHHSPRFPLESPLDTATTNTLDIPFASTPLSTEPYPRHDLSTPGAYHVGSSPSNTAYETALNVLLSLGNDRVASLPGPTPTPVTDWYFSSPNNIDHSTSTDPTNVTEWLKRLFPTCAHLPQDRAVQLLRHFRYSIAPWLDIGDPEQTFGLEICRLAMGSVPVLASLLALSHASLDSSRDIDSKELGLAQADVSESSRSGINVLSSVVIVAFASIQKFLVTTPTSWQSPFKTIRLQSLNSALSHDSHASSRLAVAWMVLRLDISVGLMTTSPVSIPDILSYSSMPLVSSHLSRDIIKYDREPLVLCAKVLNYCFSTDTEQFPEPGLGPGTMQSWKSLFEALNMWYTNRPQAFRPMLEIDDSEELFPQVFFTNGAAVLANQIYHTSMLLLLQHKPRTLQNEHGRSTLVAPLWHAQRVCGISLCNDSRASWDFSLVASFYLAAKRMTYEPQQRAILRGVDSIAATTGWNVGGLSAHLVREWQPDWHVEPAM